MSAIFGEVLRFPQGDGEVQLRVFGDEFYARYETLDGYTAVYDREQSKFCYALLREGEFVSSGVDITDSAPPEGISPGLQEDKEVRLRKVSEREEQLCPPLPDPRLDDAEVLGFGPQGGLLNGKILSKGTITGLTVLVEFADITTSIPTDEVDQMLNGENYHGNGNYCSVREYFELMSSGQLRFRNVVVGPVRLTRNRDYYLSHLFVKEAMDLVVNDLNVDLSQFDSNGDGVIDSLTFLYAGKSQYTPDSLLWPHSGVINLEYGRIKTHFYLLTGVGESTADLTIGTMCHETGHLLCRFPDLYDYGDARREGDPHPSYGIGYYCLMGAGGHLNGGRTPSPVCAYLRKLAGWCDNEIQVSDGEYIARHGDYNTVYRHQTDKSNEYFLIENRTRLGLDAYLPASGLAVYHCDILGSNELEEGTQQRHYQTALLQADGRKDLERNGNPGDSGDLFGAVNGVALSGQTNPSTRQWDGQDSGLIISDISRPGEEIHFRVSVQR